ncbi:hypothetical protein [Bordetella genomosp. 2]|uniref:hypothetical protein n=1 Tax=Bordetella genomosp. 2 TaxID=1983456 RepID=UPI0020165EA2|nr:hypothetical protein [Bordetella genomosp. 2]
MQYLIQHVAVLAGNADARLEVAVGIQRCDDGSHFDGLWSGPEDCQDFHITGNFSNKIQKRPNMSSATGHGRERNGEPGVSCCTSVFKPRLLDCY